MPKIKVVIVEDLEEVVEGLSLFIRQDSLLLLVGAYRTGEAAVLEIPILEPDIVIMDINLPGMSGIDCMRQIRKQTSDMQFMMFTVFENNDQVFEALKAGATSYLLKKTAPAQIVEAIKELHNGGAPMSAPIARKLVEVFNQQTTEKQVAESHLLTARENEVLQFVSKGLSYKEIADQLNLSFHTVKQHIRNIYEKLHVQNKTEAINKAFGNSC
ncbi:MAG: two component transcriptional regulator, LuxR family [Ferruginibacter sp.]|nr:two component transcriptional regulator, LuxR family [Ferruginibacter sp.]